MILELICLGYVGTSLKKTCSYCGHDSSSIVADDGQDKGCLHYLEFLLLQSILGKSRMPGNSIAQYAGFVDNLCDCLFLSVRHDVNACDALDLTYLIYHFDANRPTLSLLVSRSPKSCYQFVRYVYAGNRGTNPICRFGRSQ